MANISAPAAAPVSYAQPQAEHENVQPAPQAADAAHAGMRRPVGVEPHRRPRLGVEGARGAARAGIELSAGLTPAAADVGARLWIGARTPCGANDP